MARARPPKPVETVLTRESTIAAELRAGYDRLIQHNEFKPGQLVQWKQGLKNRTVDSELGVVIAVPERPREDAEWFEPLDLVIGVIDQREGFMILYCDQRRLEPIGAG